MSILPLHRILQVQLQIEDLFRGSSSYELSKTFDFFFKSFLLLTVGVSIILQVAE